MGYRGRFAPTPSGPLHFGSVVAAAGSRADALAHGGQWHLRLDDLDAPRVVPGARDAILRTLEVLGMHWDGPVVLQSSRRARHAHMLEHLRTRAHLYDCSCSRREVESAGLRGLDGPRYPGTCRHGATHPGRPLAVRIDTTGARSCIHDLLQGPVTQDLEREVGDFVVWRANGVAAYQLACITDDADAGFDHVVRGADLLVHTPRQAWLLALLGLPPPAWLHLPVALDAAGHKLSKQTLATPVDDGRPLQTLRAAFDFLGHRPPCEVDSIPALWHWIATAWDRTRIPRVAALPARPEAPA